MPYKRSEGPLKGLVLLQPDVFHDARGYFTETWNRRHFETAGLPLDFVQDNLSRSTQGVLRGMHFQAPPFGQGKLVQVLEGEVQDIVIDIRLNSPSYGQYFSIILSEQNHTIMYVPPGFAHGFLVLSDIAIFSYKCTGPYDKASEGGLKWNDPALELPWQIHDPLVAEKDMLFPDFNDFASPF